MPPEKRLKFPSVEEVSRRMREMQGSLEARNPPPSQPSEGPGFIQALMDVSPLNPARTSSQIEARDIGVAQLQETLTGPGARRVALEGAGAAAGAMATGGASLLPRLLATGGGSALGAVAAESVDPTGNPAETAATAGIFGVLTEIGASAVIRLVRGGAGSALEEGGEDVLRTLQSRGTTPTAGQISKSRLLDIGENVAEKSIGGGGRITSTREAAVRTATELAEEFATRLSSGANRFEIGEVLLDVLQDRSEAFRAAGRGLYKGIDRLTRGVTVDLIESKRIAKEILRRSGRGIPNPAVRRAARAVLSADSIVSFETAQILRSDLLGVARQAPGELVPGQAQGVAAQLAKSIDKAMASGASSLGPEARAAWRQANAFWKNGKQTFNSRFIKSLLRRDPDQVFQAIVKPNSPTNIKILRSIVKDEEVWEGLQSAFAQKLLTDAGESATGQLTGDGMFRQLRRFGHETFDAVFSAKERQQYTKLARQLQIVQNKAGGEGIGGVMIQLTQAGAIVRLAQVAASGGAVAGIGGAEGAMAAAGILVGPALFSHLVTKPAFVRHLTVGIRAAPGADRAARAFVQLARVAAQERARERPEAFVNLQPLTEGRVEIPQ